MPSKQTRHPVTVQPASPHGLPLQIRAKIINGSPIVYLSRGHELVLHIDVRNHGLSGFGVLQGLRSSPEYNFCTLPIAEHASEHALHAIFDPIDFSRTAQPLERAA
jgi:hypothetical protein